MWTCGRCRSRDRKARLAQIAKRAEGWIPLTNGVVGEGRALYRTVVDADLEGIVAKKLADPCNPKFTRWHKILNRGYSQLGRAEWFPRASRTPCPAPGTGPVDPVCRRQNPSAMVGSASGFPRSH